MKWFAILDEPACQVVVGVGGNGRKCYAELNHTRSRAPLEPCGARVHYLQAQCKESAGIPRGGQPLVWVCRETNSFKPRSHKDLAADNSYHGDERSRVVLTLPDECNNAAIHHGDDDAAGCQPPPCPLRLCGSRGVSRIPQYTVRELCRFLLGLALSPSRPWSGRWATLRWP
jgi:hypothetical protein